MRHTGSFGSAVRALVALALLLAGASASGADSRVLNALLDGVLRAHVDDGYVDYPEIARNVRFYKYLEAIAAFDPATLADDRERLAFWINAYNALAIKSVIDGVTPVDMMGRMRFFRTTEHRVAGRNFDLNSIRDLLRDLGEPRVHFALVPATYAGPKLRAEAYRGEELEQQLEDNTRDFINDKRKNRFSMAARQARISPLFEEYRDDFGGKDEAVLEFVSKYVADEEIAKALRRGTFELKYMEDDRSINGRPLD
jgi:hypothetical protein